MSDLKRTRTSRFEIVEKLQEKLNEIKYDNDPIGYCLNDDCSLVNLPMEIHMREGILEGILEVESLLNDLKLLVTE